MPEAERCPRCSSPRVVHGALHLRGGFRPQELRLFSLSFQVPGVPVSTAAAACAACGLVWSQLDAAVLRQKLHDLGNGDRLRSLLRVRSLALDQRLGLAQLGLSIFVGQPR
jgi:hypothetical protein